MTDEEFTHQEMIARMAASIMGEDSTTAEALRDLDARRERGEDAVIWYEEGGTWYVGVKRKCSVQ